MSTLSLRSYLVRDGDTLQMIAQVQMGDASRWLEIAVLNDLSHPYITRRGESYPKTVTTGDKILLPIEIVSGRSTEAIVDQSDELLYGSDLLLESSGGYGGELSVDQYGDLAIASGLASLRQDLRHRLIVPYGSLPYHPEYGSDLSSIIGRKLDTNMIEKATLEVSKVLRSDPRVVDIVDLVVRKIQTGVSISCKVLTSAASLDFKENV